jgi:DNA polymerase III subunit delta
MGQTLHVFDFLAHPPNLAPVAAVFGDEPFLKRLAINQLRAMALPDDENLAAQFDGTTVAWRDVADELSTVSLFDPSGLRLAIVRDADDFVQTNRARLEDYVERPQRRGVLVLDVSKWASNTRLYKLVDKQGVQVECRAPTVASGKQKVVDHARLVRWLVEWAETQHAAHLAKNAAVLLLEMIGPEFGLLDQEVARLVLYAGTSGKITEKLVQEVGGGWRAKTAWEVIEAALSGDAAEALRQLDRLLQSGEQPQALFGPISWSLRRFAAATRIYQRAERHGHRLRVPDALAQAGFFTWQREALAAAERQLKQLGRQRAAQLHRWLLETDLALKGSHSSPDMARLALEHLLLRMDQHLAPQRSPG